MNEPWAAEDPWQWWRDKLAGKPVEMNPNNPHAGFYRQPHKRFYGARKTFTPVAYWPGQDGQLHCRIGDDDVTPERGQEIWERVGAHPVTEEAYRAVAQDNKPWPDEHELVDMRGHNMPPEDTLEGLRENVGPLAQEAESRLKGQPIADQEEADRLANLADRLAELAKKAEELRKLERKPHDEELKRIQARWSPILALAETYKRIKYELLTPWLKREEARKKQEAEAAAAAGEPPAAEEPRRPRVGTRGRAMTLKSQKKAEITDYRVCLEFFAESEDIRSCVQMLANRAVRAGIAVPGTKVTETEKAV